jgi:RNA polymerase sigma-70 factor (ECF subfamily)
VPALASAPPCAWSAADPNRWFAEQVQPHDAALRTYLRFRFPTLRDQDDLVQETYARILRAFRAGPVTNAKALLYTTARHVALDLLRREQVVSFESLDDNPGPSVLADVPDAAEAASRGQEAELMAEAIRALPERCRRIFTLRKIYGLSYKEIAQQLGIAESTVNVQVSAGIERCRQYLLARGYRRPSS